MRVGLYNFNNPVDSNIQAGAFHIHARDEFVESDTSPIGNMVIGINPKNHTVDTVGTVVGSHEDWSFRLENATVLKLDFSRLVTPIPLTPAIARNISEELGLPAKFVYFPDDVVPASESLGTGLLRLIAHSAHQTGAGTARHKQQTAHLAAIDLILGRDDLTSDAKIELLLARDGQGKFGDAVWPRDIRYPFDIEGVMGDEFRVVHIRPWHQCSDTQRIDPDNGLLLPTEVADAFENGYVTFDAEGRIVVSPYMMRNFWNQEDSLSDFCSPLEMNRGRHIFMHYHRETIYEHWLRKFA